MCSRVRGMTSSTEVAVFRAWQAEIFAQGFAFVLAPEQAAPLQFWHHLRADVVEAARQIRKLHDEAVGGFGHEPFLHLIGEVFAVPIMVALTIHLRMLDFPARTIQLNSLQSAEIKHLTLRLYCFTNAIKNARWRFDEFFHQLLEFFAMHGRDLQVLLSSFLDEVWI